MDSAATAAAVATVLGTCQLLPQLLKTRRVRSTVGLSVAWAAMGGVLNLGWIGYRWSQHLWPSLPSPIITASLYAILLAMVVRTSAEMRRATSVATVVGASLLVAGFHGGWLLVGTMLGLWGGVQIVPALWSAFRTNAPLAIAPGLWAVTLTKATLWAYFGHQVGDAALIIYGAIVGAGSFAMLSRLVFVQSRNAAKRSTLTRRRLVQAFVFSFRR